MNINEAREALTLALNNIAEDAKGKGLDTGVKCFIANHDLCEISNDNSIEASIVAGEITLISTSTEKKMILECAVSVSDGEVSSEELLNEVNSVRNNMKEILDKLNSASDAEEAFSSFEPNEETIPESPRYNNKNFYIASGVAVAIILLLILLFK